MIDHEDEADRSGASVLERIADVLNVPVDTFYAQQDDGRDPGEGDVLAAFRALPGARERRLCLWFTRHLAGRLNGG